MNWLEIIGLGTCLAGAMGVAGLLLRAAFLVLSDEYRYLYAATDAIEAMREWKERHPEEAEKYRRAAEGGK